MKTNYISTLLAIAILFSITASKSSLAQVNDSFECSGVEISDEGASMLNMNCSQASSAFMNRWRLQQTYVPAISSLTDIPVKTLRVNIHVIQRESPLPPDNFVAGNQTHTDFLNDLVDVGLNGFYRSPSAPSDPVTCVCGSDCHLSDARIQFELQGIYYHQDDIGYGDGCSAYNYNLYGVNRESEINIFLHGYNNGVMGGCANSPTFGMATNHRVFMDDVYHRYISDPASALHPISLNIAHELGHNLGLWHTYLPTCCEETCVSSNIDYLSDVFGAGTTLCPQVCHHDGPNWGCNVNDPNNSCTNNMMGGTQQSAYFSPLQIGRMHRELSLKSIRKYVKCTGTDKPIYVTSDETWDFDFQSYHDIVIESGAKLTLTCLLTMPYLGKIIVKPNAELIVDGGRISTWCSDRWRGIYVSGNSTASQTQSPTLFGKLTVKNGAIIEHVQDGICNYGLTSGGTTDWGSFGGIIQAKQSSFVNNRYGPYFGPYSNFLQSGGNQYPTNDLSYFDRCEFRTDDDYGSGIPAC